MSQDDNADQNAILSRRRMLIRGALVSAGIGLGAASGVGCDKNAQEEKTAAPSEEVTEQKPEPETNEPHVCLSVAMETFPLTLTSTPSGATVYNAAGDTVGVTPWTGEVEEWETSAGPWRLEHEGYEPYVVNINPRTHPKLEAKLIAERPAPQVCLSVTAPDSILKELERTPDTSE